MEKSLFVDLCMQGNPPVTLSITVPVPAREKRRQIVHLFHCLGRIWQIIAQLFLELLLIFRLLEDIFPVIQDLAITIEQHAINLSLPGIELLHCWYPLIRFPIGVFGILEERLDLDDVGFLSREKVSVEPCPGHISVISAEAGREIRKDLLVESVDRNLGDVHMTAG